MGIQLCVDRVDRECETHAATQPVEAVAPRDMFDIVREVMAERGYEPARRLGQVFSNGGDWRLRLIGLRVADGRARWIVSRLSRCAQGWSHYEQNNNEGSAVHGRCP